VPPRSSQIENSPWRTDLPDPIEVLGLPVRPLDMRALVASVVNRARARIPTTGMYANAHTCNLAAKDQQFRRALRGCDLLYADGASVVWASRFSTSKKLLPQRMTAADYFPKMVQACAEQNVSIFMLGNQPGVTTTASRRLQIEYPALRIVGTHHGHFDLAESPAVINKINAAKPDILFVGMSSPRQELWLAQHAQEIDAPVRWCVGALFDYIAGLEPRGPAWLCAHGGEWLFRLLADPGGKWKRYLIGNPLFVYHALRWRLSQTNKQGIEAAQASPAVV
jgi:N-acetylglucosaminyldiphosphoundecaprenol N-acetyl-beta-D-mannosaminyltransferase